MAATFKHPLISKFVAEANERGVPEHLRGQFIQQRYRLAFGVSETLSALGPCTAPTQIVWLTEPDVGALLSSSDGDGKSCGPLAERIDAALKELSSSGAEGGAFLKLDSRSPKDAAVGRTDDAGLVEEVLRCCVEAAAGHGLSAQSALQGLMTALQGRLRVRSGAEAVALLRRSWRVREDLQSVRPLLEHGVRTCVALRAWDSRMASQPQGEFRAFVVENRITACSQYDHMCFYPKLVSRRSEIVAAIAAFFEAELRPRLAHISSYIVDLFVDIDADPITCRVVELNSFESWTGACLFSWTQDREVLLGAKTPFEFRCLERPLPEDDLLELIPLDWHRIISDRLGLKPPAMQPPPVSQQQQQQQQQQRSCCIQ